VEYAVGDGSDRPSRLVRTPAGGLAQTIAFGYDGGDVTRATWSGAAVGEYVYGYDANFFLNSMRLTSGADSVTTSITRDAEGLPTAISGIAIVRNGPAGAPSAMTTAGSSLALTYDEVAQVTRRTLTVAGVQRFAAEFTYDRAGRVASRTETVGGTTRAFTFSYDRKGQLLAVTRDGAVVERYGYDVNGNRTSAQSSGAAAGDASYDAQDRLARVGATNYQYDADGQLVRRGGDTFVHGARGDLLAVTVGGADRRVRV
jgi:YD repeat-containing protein